METAKKDEQLNMLMERSSQGLVSSSANVSAYLEKAKSKLAEACGSMFSPEKVIKICAALVANSENNALLGCSIESFYTALIDALNAGVLPLMGRAYLIPYKGKCTFMLGYQGMLDIAARQGITARAYAVCDKDEFSYVVGDSETLLYKPSLDSVRDREHLKAVFCRVQTRETVTYELMSKDEVEAVRKTSKAANTGPWVNHYIEMAKKTVVRRAAKYWPLTEDVSMAINTDNDTEIIR